MIGSFKYDKVLVYAKQQGILIRKYSSKFFQQIFFSVFQYFRCFFTRQPKSVGYQFDVIWQYIILNIDGYYLSDRKHHLNLLIDITFNRYLIIVLLLPRQATANTKINQGDCYYFYRHFNYNKLDLMKKIPKVVTGSAATPVESAISAIARYFLRGIFVGIVFEGSFLMFSFENRIVRGVTSNRLEQIHRLERQTGQEIARGQVPKIPLEWLRESFRLKFQKGKEQDKK